MIGNLEIEQVVMDNDPIICPCGAELETKEEYYFILCTECIKREVPRNASASIS